MANQTPGPAKPQNSGENHAEKGDKPITIKKYANRRLYNTATSSYVTLDHLCQIVKNGQDFVVYDAKTGEDITRSVLTQIIVEEESKGQNLLPIGFLRQLISLYGGNMQWIVPRYLEHSLHTLSSQQDQMREYMQNTMTGMFPFASLEDMSKQNVAMFERALKMFSPMGGGQAGENPPEGSGSAPTEEASTGDQGLSLEEMRDRLDALQRQMEALGREESQLAERTGVEQRPRKSETPSSPVSKRQNDDKSVRETGSSDSKQ